MWRILRTSGIQVGFGDKRQLAAGQDRALHARREILETYVKRLEKLENLVDSFEGVSKCYALQAGREVRIMVESDKVSDEQAFWLTKDIARKIETELQYPGQIKVTVIREMRVVEYAR